MRQPTDKQVPCFICGKNKRRADCVPAATIRSGLAAFIDERQEGRWDPQGYICSRCLDEARAAHLTAELAVERGALSALEREVAKRAALHDTIAEHIGERFERRLTLGGRLADRVAAVGGSWPFVIAFALVLAVWITVNVVLGGRAFDPYPYILLNLALSSLAAIQAPIIMMSQNRASARDRLQAEEDFKINLKAELEIAILHDKVDHLLHAQWERMMEAQQAQLEMLEELTHRRAPR